MSAELLAQVGGPVAAGGLAVLVLARPRAARLAGLAGWVVGMALFVPYLAPSGSAARLAAAALGGAALALALGWLFVRRPWTLAFLALAAAPARLPVAVGDTSANLLVPLYGVVAGAAVALGWTLVQREPRSRELGPLAWPLALVVLWLGVSELWTGDVREASIVLFFFVLPFSLLALALARLPWSERALAWLAGLLGAMAVVFAAIGLWQWATRDIFWNPKVIVGNAYAPFYRVNSVFWDPSIYGRFRVVAILAALALLLFRVRPRLDLPLGALIVAAWVGLLPSFSQSSFAALVAGVAVATVLAWRWRAAAALGLVAAVMIPVGFVSPQLDDVREALFGNGSGGLNKATSGRSQLIGNGVRIAFDHPLVGVGVGGFKDAYADRLDLRRAPPSAASHNTPVTVVAELGVVGLALFGWLVVAALAAALRHRAGENTAAKAGIVAGLGLLAILVHSLFYNAFFEDPLTWGVLGLAALAAARLREEPS